MELAEELLADLEWAYQDEISMRTDYSGRGMYGTTCLGFTVPNAARFMFSLGILMAEWQPHADVELGVLHERLAMSMHDNMGLSTIVYWPSIKVVGDAD